MNSDEILRVLNGLEPVDTTGWVFCVITDASSLTAGTGRMAGETIDLGEPEMSTAGQKAAASTKQRRPAPVGYPAL